MTAYSGIVMVVDDDPSVRTALNRLARSVALDCEVFATADDYLAWPDAGRPTCVVLDVRMPGTSGLDLQRRMAEAPHRVPIIFLTAHADVRMSVRAMKAGAVDFLTKPFQEQEMLDAIRHALDLDREARRAHADYVKVRERYDSLTPRERQVLQRVVAGRLNKQIAGELDIAEKTVKMHRGEVMQKMQAGSLAELVSLTADLHLPTT